MIPSRPTPSPSWSAESPSSSSSSTRWCATTRGQLIALSKASNSVAGTSSINDQGRFAIGSLDPGIYNLSVNMNGYTSYQVVATIHVKEGERINGFEIALARGGMVLVKVTGCEWNATARPMVHFRHEAGRIMAWPLARSPGGGEAVMSAYCTLEAGAWTAAIAAAGIGYADRSFTISPGLTTELTIGKEDFSQSQEPVSVNGVITGADGTPAPECALRFSAHSFVAVFAGERRKECRTDRGGQQVDMGRIVLESCGRLILAVKDHEGNSIEDFSLFLEGEKLSRYRRLSLSKGRFSFSNLPRER